MIRISNAHTIFLSAALASALGSQLMASSSPLPDAKRALLCAEQIVGGATLFIGSKQLVAQNQAFPLPYILANLGLKHWLKKPAKTPTGSELRVLHTLRISASGVEEELNSPLSTLKNPSTTSTAFVSLGEGNSPLLPFVATAVADQARVYGVDTAYGAEQDSYYYGRNYMHAIQDDARRLSAFSDQSTQSVVSHGLLSELNREDRVAAIRESFRILAPTGVARHSILVPDLEVLGRDGEFMQNHETALVATATKLVEEALRGESYQLAVAVSHPQLVTRDTNTQGLNVLLMVRRPTDQLFSWETLFGK